jgi:hypothetical protein
VQRKGFREIDSNKVVKLYIILFKYINWFEIKMLLYTFGSSLNSWAVPISLVGWAVNEREMGFDGYDFLERISFRAFNKYPRSLLIFENTLLAT